MTRPTTMTYFDELIGKNSVALKEEKEKGRKVVGYYCVFSPVELIEATGAIPVGLCATKQDTIPDAEKVLPRNLCPLIKSSYGFAATGKCPYFHFSDVVMAETTCDGKKKMYELMSKFKPMIVLDIPNTTNTDWRVEHWTREINRAKAYFEEHLGTEVTKEKLSEVIKMYNDERKLLMELVELNKHDPAPLSGTDLLKVLWGKSFQINREEFTAKVKELIAEIKELLKTSEIGKKGPRILVTGSPTGVGQEKVMNIIQEAGGQVILQEACSGIKSLIDLVDETIDPIEALARKYMDIPCSCSSPNSRRLEITENLVKEFDIDGIVDITLQACHTYNIESYSLKEHMKNTEAQTPVLQIETDYSDTDIQQIKLRVDAFLEIL
jgi:benzoyl-CoA reductase/2-hydroxyglutaryl-CoA dehydratase subunit BcrC/BadD/HgdB